MFVSTVPLQGFVTLRLKTNPQEGMTLNNIHCMLCQGQHEDTNPLKGAILMKLLESCPFTPVVKRGPSYVNILTSTQVKIAVVAWVNGSNMQFL